MQNHASNRLALIRALAIELASQLKALRNEIANPLLAGTGSLEVTAFHLELIRDAAKKLHNSYEGFWWKETAMMAN